ncbi:MAG: threonylcarbamoyl-AMP synthase [Planctomycetes bacterium]|nr:threonylcarbamoyl-AMP synthase [Planctomycetota bacterium]
MSRVVDPTPDAIEAAAARLRAGHPVAFPTETVYGLGAGTLDAAALEAVYTLKGRPDDNPLIAHVAGAAAARALVTRWDTRCDALVERFWPGPLTLVLPKAAHVPDRATAGLATIAVRAPRHPVAVDLLAAYGAAISAPSANRSGHVSATTARHVADDFADVADLLVLDGGPCAIGLESTVLDLTGATPVVLRPGSVTEEALGRVLGPVRVLRIDTQAASPGTSMRHYAPRTPCVCVETEELVAMLAETAHPVAVLCFDTNAVPSPHRPIAMPQGAGTYAAQLYDALREADRMSVERIVIERPPETNEIWKAIVDRIRRATA